MSTALSLPEIDPSILTPVARAALGHPTAAVTTWERPVPLTAADAVFNLGSHGVYRVRGVATVEGVSRPWSAVLKVLRSPAGITTPDGTVITQAEADDGSRFNYWKRETLVYQEGLLHSLPPGIAAPRCLAITERLDEHIWLWTEDLAAASTEPWPLDRYALAARHLGAFNGAYAAGRPLPVASWLSPAPLQSWLEVVIARIMDLLDAGGFWQHPLLRAALPGAAVDRLRALWADREALLAAGRRSPRAFCHLDAFRGNLVARRTPDGQDETVAIDWAWAGTGTLGEELGPLVVATVLDGALPVESLPELEEAALEGYLAGLGEAGWHGDPRLVRLGYAASAVLRYSFLLAADVARATFDEGFRTAQEARHGTATDIVARQLGTMIAVLLDRADEVRALQ